MLDKFAYEAKDGDEDEFAPRVKYTEADSTDIYLVKSGKLLMADSTGFTKKCLLIKEK